MIDEEFEKGLEFLDALEWAVWTPEEQAALELVARMAVEARNGER